MARTSSVSVRVWGCRRVQGSLGNQFFCFGAFAGGRAGLYSAPVRARHGSDHVDAAFCVHAAACRGHGSWTKFEGERGGFEAVAHPVAAGARRLLGVDGEDGVERKKQKQNLRRPCTHGQKSVMPAWRCSLQLRPFGGLEEDVEVVRFPASEAPDDEHGDGSVFFKRRPWR